MAKTIMQSEVIKLSWQYITNHDNSKDSVVNDDREPSSWLHINLGLVVHRRGSTDWYVSWDRHDIECIKLNSLKN